MTFQFYLSVPAVFFAAFGAPVLAIAQESNACPVDGCIVEILSIKADGQELALEFGSNFMPDMSKNHIHVWWGENFTVQQVSNDAETVHGVKQGNWHPTADYPDYITTGAASVSERGEAESLCVSAADRNHDILDVDLVSCRPVVGVLAN